MKPVVEVREVSFGYGPGPLFQDLSLSVEAGDFVGLVGPNGSGKSTLLKIILGLLKPHQGRVALFGQELDQFQQWAEVGYVSQKATAFNTGFPATVEEVVKGGLWEGKSFFRPWRKADPARVAEALALVGLEGMEKALLGELSGGQQQRVFLARALVGRPKAVFLDEPTVGLDPLVLRRLADLLAGLNRETGLTIVVVTHHLSSLVRDFNRIFYLNRGRLDPYRPGEFLARCPFFEEGQDGVSAV